jgi:hypothetical protein
VNPAGTDAAGCPVGVARRSMLSKKVRIVSR